MISKTVCAIGAAMALLHTSVAAQVHQIATGWNLLGNNNGADLVSASLFGTPTTPTSVSNAIASVWAWDATLKRWAFFTPSLSDADLAAYAAGNNYSVLSKITSGMGFWVNATAATTLNVGSVPAGSGLPTTFKGIRIDSLTYASDTSNRCKASVTFTNTTTSSQDPYLYFDVVVNNVAIRSSLFSYTMLPGTTAMDTNSIYDSDIVYLACGTFSLRFNAPASSVYAK